MYLLLFCLTVPLETASLADGECIVTSKKVLPLSENTVYHFCCLFFSINLFTLLTNLFKHIAQPSR